jgi:hypothetical protein
MLFLYLYFQVSERCGIAVELLYNVILFGKALEA